MKTATNSIKDMKSWEVDISDTAYKICKTILLIGRPSGMNEVARILRADSAAYFRDPKHARLETTGSMTYTSRIELRLNMQALVEKGVLGIKEAQYGSIEVTPAGKAFLENPQPLIVEEASVTLTPFDHFVHRHLKDLRSELATNGNLPFFEVFNDLSIDHIMKQLPETVKELNLILGLDDERIAAYGSLILKSLDECNQDWHRVKNLHVLRKTKHATHQEVSRLFQEGFGVDEIGGILGIKTTTVESYLIDFHTVGLMDMRPWIEEYVDASVLKKAVNYFKKNMDVKLREAKEKLKIEYNFLHLARAYVRDFTAAPYAEIA